MIKKTVKFGLKALLLLGLLGAVPTLQSHAQEVVNLSDHNQDQFYAEISSALQGSSNEVRIISTSDIVMDNLGLDITIPENKKIIWEAKISAINTEDHPLLILRGNGSFEFKNGFLKHSNGRDGISIFDNIKMEVNGGLIEASKIGILINTDIDGSFTMNDGQILCHDSNVSVCNAISVAEHNQGRVVINGGFLFGFNERPLVITHTLEKLTGVVSVDFDLNNAALQNTFHYNGGKILAFHYKNINPRYYLKGSSAGLDALPDGQNDPKPIWEAQGIHFGNRLVDIPLQYPGVIINELTLPSDTLYKDDFTAPTLPKEAEDEGARLRVTYNDDLQKPILPGEYEVKVSIAHIGDPDTSHYVPTNEISLGKFKIKKRQVTLTPVDATMTVNQSLPAFTATVRGDGIAAGDDLGYRVVTTADGRTVGTFPLNIELDPSAAGTTYDPNGYDLVLNEGALTVQAENQQPQNPQQPQ
ncbi:MAG: hypothetical protein Q4A19_07240, partial [Johnsonella sp.]|nr:hypothetical protein [Johnsonella sp.]